MQSPRGARVSVFSLLCIWFLTAPLPGRVTQTNSAEWVPSLPDAMHLSLLSVIPALVKAEGEAWAAGLDLQLLGLYLGGPGRWERLWAVAPGFSGAREPQKAAPGTARSAASSCLGVSLNLPYQIHMRLCLRRPRSPHSICVCCYCYHHGGR